MEWDFESFMDKELWEICEEAERIEKQKQEEKDVEQIISQLQMEETSEIKELKQEEEQKTIEEQEQVKTEEIIQTKEEETEEISEVEQETIEEIKEEILEVDESEKEPKQEEEQKQSTSEKNIMFLRPLPSTEPSTEQSQSKSGEEKKLKIFDSELAIEIAKSRTFKDYLKRYLRFEAWTNNRSSYSKIYRIALISDVPGKYIKFETRIKVKYTLRGKQEVLKLIPPGAYPIIYGNQNEIWIAINEGTEIFIVKITNLDEKIDAIIPSPQIFNLAFLLVYPNNVEYLGVEIPNNRDFPIYVRCNENCYWMLGEVLEIISQIFVNIMYKDTELLEEIRDEHKSEYKLNEKEKILKEVEERLNSEEYINEIVSVLEKLEENPEYKSFTEEAKSYHYFLLKHKRGYLTEARNKTRVYFEVKEYLESKDELPDGIYLLIFRDMRATSGYDYRTYYVRDKGDNWDIVKIEEENFAIPTVIFELVYLVKYKGKISYVITKLPYRRFYLYMLCSANKCHWMPPVVFNAIWPVVRKHIRKIMREVFKINVEEKAEEEILNEEQLQTQELTQEEQKQSTTIETEYTDNEMIIKKIKEYLNSEDYKQELISALRKLLNENPKYKEFNEFAKRYYPKLIMRKNVPSEVHRWKEEYWLSDKEGSEWLVMSFYKKTNTHQLRGVYLVAYKWYEKVPGHEYEHNAYVVSRKGVDRNGNERFYVRFIGEEFGVRNMPYTVSGLVYFVFLNKDNYYFITTELPRELYTYLYCGTSEKVCIWMPEMVLKAIWPIFQKMAEKIKREIFGSVIEGKAEHIEETKQEEILEITEIKEEKQEVMELKQEEQKQLQTEEIKRIENLFNKRVERNLEIVFCKWNEYVKNAYLLPYITNDDYGDRFVSYHHPVHINGKVSLIRGWAQIIPKPVFLPKQIHIKNPDEIKQIPEGVYPIIRLYQFEEEKSQKIDRKLFFALSPNTEVVFEINQQTEKFLGHLLQAKWLIPLSYSPEFAIVWNNTIIFRNLLDFDEEFRQIIMYDFSNKNFQYSSSYWVIRKENGYMYYLPEVLFLHLVGENVKPKEEPFVAEMILNSQKRSQDWYNWVQSIADKYNKVYFDNDKLKTIEFSDLHKMPGVWYVKEIKIHYRNPRIYKLDYYELVIINMRDKEKIFKVRADFDLGLTEKDVGRVFITVWPDGTIGRWVIEF
jgi:hypothetical protein